MTDKEIIMASEWCSDDEAPCDLCPYYPQSERVIRCSTNMMRDTLRLITCQKSQIEDLYVTLDERIQRIKELEAEIDRLQNHNLIMARKHFDDGIRELAERLKKKSEIYCTASNGAAETVLAVSCDDIDTLVKEMTEDES